MHDESRKTKYFSGPLNLFREAKQADTVMGTELTLSAAEFDALDMMVEREGEPVTFEQLYDAIWKTPDGVDNSAEARAALDRVIEQVSIAGESFMEIEFSPESGYTFQTHWGRNWQARQQQEDPFVLPSGEMVVPGVSQSRGKRVVAGLVAGAVVTAAAIVLIITAVMNDIATDTFVINEEIVPLAARESTPDDDNFGIDITEDGIPLGDVESAFGADVPDSADGGEPGDDEPAVGELAYDEPEDGEPEGDEREDGG